MWFLNHALIRPDFKSSHVIERITGSMHTGRYVVFNSLLWRHNGCDGISNQQSHDCLFNLSFRRRSKKTSKLRVTGLCAGKSSLTGEFPAEMASNAKNVSIWWGHHIVINSLWTQWMYLQIGSLSWYCAWYATLKDIGKLCIYLISR